MEEKSVSRANIATRASKFLSAEAPEFTPSSMFSVPTEVTFKRHVPIAYGAVTNVSVPKSGSVSRYERAASVFEESKKSDKYRKPYAASERMQNARLRRESKPVQVRVDPLSVPVHDDVFDIKDDYVAPRKASVAKKVVEIEKKPEVILGANHLIRTRKIDHYTRKGRLMTEDEIANTLKSKIVMRKRENKEQALIDKAEQKRKQRELELQQAKLLAEQEERLAALKLAEIERLEKEAEFARQEKLRQELARVESEKRYALEVEEKNRLADEATTLKSSIFKKKRNRISEVHAAQKALKEQNRAAREAFLREKARKKTLKHQRRDARLQAESGRSVPLEKILDARKRGEKFAQARRSALRDVRCVRCNGPYVDGHVCMPSPYEVEEKNADTYVPSPWMQTFIPTRADLGKRVAYVKESVDGMMDGIKRNAVSYLPDFTMRDLAARDGEDNIIMKYIDSKDGKYSKMMQQVNFTVDEVQKMILFVYQLYRGRNFFDYYSCCYMYASTHLSGAFDKTVVSAVAASLATATAATLETSSSKPELRAEFSLSEGIKGLADKIEFVMENDMMKAISLFLVSVASMKFFSRDVAKEIFHHFGVPETKTPIALVKNVLLSIAAMVGIGEMIMKGVPILECLFKPDPFKAAVADANKLMTFENLTYTGLPVEFHMDRSEYIKQGEALIKLLGVLLEGKTSWSTRYQQANPVRDRLIASVVMMKKKQNSLSRIPPIGIVVCGPPSIGKSHLLEFIVKIFCDVKKIPYTQGIVYPRNKTSQYWENYDPYSHRVIHYTELASLHENIAKTKGDERIDEITSVVDSLAFSCDMAALESKGVTPCLAELVIADTNNQSLNLDHIVCNPAAYRRRFIFITPVVKEQYRKEGKPGIDYAKTKDGSMLMDRWNFRINSYEVDDEKKSTLITHMHAEKADSDIYALYDWLFAYMQKRISEEGEIKKMVDEGFVGYDPATRRVDRRPGYDPVAAAIDDIEVKEILEFDASKVPSRGDPGRSYYDSDSDEDVREFNKFLIERRVPLSSESFVSFTRSRLVDLQLIFSVVWNYLFVNIFLMLFSFADWSVKARDLVFEFCNGGWRRTLVAVIISFGSAVGYFSPPTALALTVMAGVNHAIVYTGLRAAILDSLNSKVGYWSNKMRELFGYERVNYALAEHQAELHRHRLILGVTIAGVPLIAFICYKLFAKKKEDHRFPFFSLPEDIRIEAHTEFKNKSEATEKVNVIEEKIGAALAVKRVATKTTEGFNVIQGRIATPHVGSVVDLQKKMWRNQRICKVITETKEGDRITFDTKILGVCGEFALISTHALNRLNGESIIQVSQTGYADVVPSVWQKTKIDLERVVRLTGDVSLLRLSQINFVDILCHFAPDFNFPLYSRGYIGHAAVTAGFKGKVTYNAMDEEITIPMHFDYSWPDHARGECGSGLIINLAGDSFAIVGLHSAGAHGDPYAVACPVSQKEIKAALEKLTNNSVLMPLCSESDTFRFDVSEPTIKSAFSHEVLHGVNYFGKLPGPVIVKNKSKLQKSFIAGDDVDYLQEEFFPSFVPTTIYGRPMMEPTYVNKKWISPYNNALKKMVSQKACIDHAVLEKCISRLTSHIVSNLRAQGITKLTPLTMDQAINGAKDDAFLKRISASKAAGFGLKGLKDAHIPIVEEKENDVIRQPTEDLMADILRILDCYAQGKCSDVVYTAQLKDEAREISKCASGATRVFYVSPLAFLIVSRMMLSSIYTLMVERSRIFGAAIGSNMHADAASLYEYLTSHSRNIMEGDYSSFDLNTPFDIGWAAASVIEGVLSAMGYNEEALKIVRGLMTDGLFPLVSMLLDVFCLPGLEPSGKYATAEDNSLRGLLMMMLAWYSCDDTSSWDFFEHVRTLLYGDDVLAAVSDQAAPFFNNLTYTAFCRDVMCMTFTPVVKDSVVVNEFVTPETMSFLKRTFVYHNDLGRIVAPLSLDSIFKTLTWIEPSRSVNPQEQYLSIFNSCLREFFFHVDKNNFEKLRQWFISKYRTHFKMENYVEKMFPCWSELKTSIFECSPVIAVGEGGQHSAEEEVFPLVSDNDS